MKLYASLTGPLLGLYLPAPAEIQTEDQFRVALNTSRLKNLWCSVYDKEQTNESIARWGGQILPDKFSRQLDYDHVKVFHPENS